MPTTATFEAQTRQANGKLYTLLLLNGGLDKKNIAEFEEKVAATLQNEHAYLVLDLGALDLINSHTVSYFENLHRKLEVAEKRLAFVNVNEELRDTLEFVGLSKLIEIFDEETKFVEALLREEI